MFISFIEMSKIYVLVAKPRTCTIGVDVSYLYYIYRSHTIHTQFV